jgi:ribosomal protein L25 (general stress protein Ctc)
MPIRIKLKDQEKPIMVRVNRDVWTKAFEQAREKNGMIEINEDGRTLAIKAREIVLWELVDEPDHPGVSPEPVAAEAAAAV